MAHVIEGIPLKGLRKAHLRQLAGYIRDRDRDGYYYAPKEQFEKRHADLLKMADWLDGVAADNSSRLPNASLTLAGKESDT
jgi:hypothetical protein